MGALRYLTITILGAMILLVGHHKAQTTEPAFEPLMIIRFNQPQIQYEQALQRVLRKALEVNPQMQFDLVYIVPAHSDGAALHDSQRQSAIIARNIEQILQRHGINNQAIHASYHQAPSAPYHEVHLFVR